MHWEHAVTYLHNSTLFMEAQEQKRGGETVDRKQDILMLLKPVLFLPSPLNEEEAADQDWRCLENPRDGGAWWAAVYGVTQSRTRLK